MFNSRLTPNGAFFSSLSGMIMALYIYFAPYLGAFNVLPESMSGNLGYGIICGAATSFLLALLSITFWNYRFDFEPLRRAGEIDRLAEGGD
jgi:Na+(H+)/acetate symporter ActP